MVSKIFKRRGATASPAKACASMFLLLVVRCFIDFHRPGVTCTASLCAVYIERLNERTGHIFRHLGPQNSIKFRDRPESQNQK